MFVTDVRLGIKIEASIGYLSAKEFTGIKKDEGFEFDWSGYKKKEIYKLCVAGEKKIQGLMCITDHTSEEINAIEIKLLEIRKENRDKHKLLDRIAGCLIAFACKESIKRGHNGYIFLFPKSELIRHYQAIYYLTYIGPIGKNLTGIMVGEESIARKLIKKYLE